MVSSSAVGDMRVGKEGAKTFPVGPLAFAVGATLMEEAKEGIEVGPVATNALM